MTIWSQYRLELRDVFSLSLVYCEELESTDTIIVHITSTAMGSNATYQCRDDPSDDVYTTQCTSDGVWDPNPLSTVDCTKSDNESKFQYAKQCMTICYSVGSKSVNNMFLVYSCLSHHELGKANHYTL